MTEKESNIGLVQIFLIINLFVYLVMTNLISIYAVWMYQQPGLEIWLINESLFWFLDNLFRHTLSGIGDYLISALCLAISILPLISLVGMILERYKLVYLFDLFLAAEILARGLRITQGMWYHLIAVPGLILGVISWYISEKLQDAGKARKRADVSLITQAPEAV